MSFSDDTAASDAAAATNPTVGFVTLGCPKNEVDSDRMAALLLAAGYSVTDNLDDADAVIVNTCGFLSEATEQSVVTTLELIDETQGERPVLMAGCAVSRYGNDLESEMPEVAAFVPVLNEVDIALIVANVLDACGNHHLIPTESAEQGCEQYCDARLLPGPSSYIKIADGCDRECAFCAIPLIRGPYISKDVDRLVAEAEMLAEAGAREIVLVAQDTTNYGKGSADAPDHPSFPQVVRRVSALPDVEWLRLMYLQPSGVTTELLETIAELPAVLPYIEMPLQHSASHLLRSMRRTGSAGEYKQLIEQIRSTIPGVTLRTTIIVGYPGETDEDFEGLLQFLEQVRFDYVGIFAYSQEDGTEASLLPGQIDEDLKIERLQRAVDLADQIGWERASNRIGSTTQVLVLGFDADEMAWWGRAPFQAPDIDGVVYIHPAEGSDTCDLQAGAMVTVTISDSVLYDLIGQVHRED